MCLRDPTARCISHDNARQRYVKVDVTEYNVAKDYLSIWMAVRYAHLFLALVKRTVQLRKSSFTILSGAFVCHMHKAFPLWMRHSLRIAWRMSRLALDRGDKSRQIWQITSMEMKNCRDMEFMNHFESVVIVDNQSRFTCYELVELTCRLLIS